MNYIIAIIKNIIAKNIIDFSKGYITHSKRYLYVNGENTSPFFSDNPKQSTVFHFEMESNSNYRFFLPGTVQVLTSSIDEKKPLSVRDSDGSLEQLFYFESVGNGDYVIKNKENCLEIHGKYLYLKKCGYIEAQRFQILAPQSSDASMEDMILQKRLKKDITLKTDNELYLSFNRDTYQLYLDDRTGAALILKPIKEKNGYRLKHVLSGQVLDFENNKSIVLSSTTTSPSQLFHFESQDRGRIKVVNLKTGECLTRYDSSLALARCDEDSSSQSFVISGAYFDGRNFYLTEVYQNRILAADKRKFLEFTKNKGRALQFMADDSATGDESSLLVLGSDLYVGIREDDYVALVPHPVKFVFDKIEKDYVRIKYKKKCIEHLVEENLFKLMKCSDSSHQVFNLTYSLSDFTNPDGYVYHAKTEEFRVKKNEIQQIERKIATSVNSFNGNLYKDENGDISYHPNNGVPSLDPNNSRHSVKLLDN